MTSRFEWLLFSADLNGYSKSTLKNQDVRQEYGVLTFFIGDYSVLAEPRFIVEKHPGDGLLEQMIGI